MKPLHEIKRDVGRLANDIEEQQIRLERNDVRVDRFGILWVPVSRRLRVG